MLFNYFHVVFRQYEDKIDHVYLISPNAIDCEKSQNCLYLLSKCKNWLWLWKYFHF